MKYLIVCIFIFSGHVGALEVPFSEGAADVHYRKSDLIFVGTKIGGPLNFSDYVKVVQRFEKKDDDELRKKWLSQAKKTEVFLVLKTYKGDAAYENEVIELRHDVEFQAVSMGKTYIVFADHNKYFGWCDAFDIDVIPKDDLELLLKKDSDHLVAYLVGHKLHYCLNPHPLGWKNSLQ